MANYRTPRIPKSGDTVRLLQKTVQVLSQVKQTGVVGGTPGTFTIEPDGAVYDSSTGNRVPG